jgi:hypothetical protein
MVSICMLQMQCLDRMYSDSVRVGGTGEGGALARGALARIAVPITRMVASSQQYA